MAISGVCVRPQFRGNPGACLSIAMQAFAWAADPFAVCNKAYVVKNRAGEETIAFEAQLIHAIVNTRAPLKRRLQPTYKGENGKPDTSTRSCLIQGWLIGEDDVFEYESPMIKDIGVKNSPLWIADPDQQLHYYSTRAWARRHVPEILLGIYTPEEARGEIIDVEATEIGERPRREDFAEPEPATNEAVKSYTPEAEDEPEVTADPFVVIGAHGDEQQFDTAEAAAEAFEAAIEEAANARADLGVAACWENNAALIFDLRERGYDDLADGLGRFYSEQLAAADSKPAAPSEPTAQRGRRPASKSAAAATTAAPEKTAPAEPPESPKIEVIKPIRLSQDRGWDWPAFAEAMIAAGRRLPPARLSEFRGVQASMFDVLRQSNKAEWARVNQALADHEREGTAA
ncbi:MAG TPA: recombinase RecT [Xanthobacteraceae bacterium]|nr:recombinase RecT [Xanthobacteraceae bacterium]